MIEGDFLPWTDTGITVLRAVLSTSVLVELLILSAVALRITTALPGLIAELAVLALSVSTNELIVRAVAANEARVLLPERIAAAESAPLATTQPTLTTAETTLSAAQPTLAATETTLTAPQPALATAESA